MTGATVFHRVTHAVSLHSILNDLGFSHLLPRGAVYVDGRRAAGPIELAEGQVLRLHTRPKRFAVPPLVPRLVHVDDDVFVLDKPGGVPTHATLDNAHENAAARLAVELGEPAFVTHRLDIPTDGLLILARTPAAQRAVNREFERGRVTKRYLARADRRVADGEYRHFIDPVTHVPRAIAPEPRPGWWDCRLVVEGAALVDGRWDHAVRPLTGKTHQIRAQFAALGAPLLGDETYGGRPSARFGLSCVGLALTLGGRRRDFVRAPIYQIE